MFKQFLKPLSEAKIILKLLLFQVINTFLLEDQGF